MIVQLTKELRIRHCKTCRAPMKTGARYDNCNECLNWHGLLTHVAQCRQYRARQEVAA